MAVEAPFSPVGDEAHAENLELMRAADLVVVSAVPVSHGNARNVEAAREALGAGTPVWVDEGVRAGDFAGVVDGLADDGAQFFAGEEALLAAVLARGRRETRRRETGRAWRFAAPAPSPCTTRGAPQVRAPAAGRRPLRPRRPAPGGSVRKRSRRKAA